MSTSAVPRIRRYGESALLLDLGPDAPPGETLRWDAAIRAAAPPGLDETVPAAGTVLVRLRAGADVEALATRLRALSPAPLAPSDGPLVEVPVRYDGPDLAEVADLTGLSQAEVVERHLAAAYRVLFCGFSPGFGYLGGLDPALRAPRLSTPRTRVPAGSVAIAGDWAAVYPQASPGGWRLLGHTDVRLWDLDRDPPALLAPGTRVRFVDAG